MKRAFLLLTALALALSLAACGSKAAPEVTIDYGASSVFTQADMDEAIDRIREEFSGWEGCELHSISYSSDAECNNDDNISWMNELEKADGAEETYTQCIMFRSDFHSPKNGGGAWNADQEYTGWQWWLARSDGGRWKLMTWGYG